MRCPECFKEVSSRVFYDHMCEYHGWSLAEAEKYADDLWLEKNVDPWKKLSKVKEWHDVHEFFLPKPKAMDELGKILSTKSDNLRSKD